MAEFVIKLNNEVNERVFLKKLETSFNKINSKNLLLDRSLDVFNNKKNIYAIVNIKPIFPNIPFWASTVALILFTIIFFVFHKQWTFLLWGGGVLMLMAFAWTKPFFYLLLIRSIKKNNIKKTELL